MPSPVFLSWGKTAWAWHCPGPSVFLGGYCTSPSLYLTRGLEWCDIVHITYLVLVEWRLAVGWWLHCGNYNERHRVNSFRPYKFFEPPPYPTWHQAVTIIFFFLDIDFLKNLYWVCYNTVPGAVLGSWGHSGDRPSHWPCWASSGECFLAPTEFWTPSHSSLWIGSLVFSL